MKWEPIALVLLALPAFAQQPAALPPQDASLLCTPGAYRQAAVGQTTVQFTIDEQGKTHDARVVKGFREDLDKQALVAIQETTFKPATQAGRSKSVVVRSDVTFDCRLPGGPVEAGPGIMGPKPLQTVDPSPNKPWPGGAGKVVFWVIVGTDGHVERLGVIKTPGDTFTQAAETAVRQSVWQPATKDGKPVNVMINFEVNFH